MFEFALLCIADPECTAVPRAYRLQQEWTSKGTFGASLRTYKAQRGCDVIKI